MTFDESEIICKQLSVYIDDEHEGYYCNDNYRRKVESIIPMPIEKEERWNFLDEVFKKFKTPKDAAVIVNAIQFVPYVIFKKLDKNDMVLYYEPASKYWNF